MSSVGIEGGKERLESPTVKNTESTSAAKGGRTSPKSSSGKYRTGVLYLASIGNLRQRAKNHDKITSAGSATRKVPPLNITPEERNNHVAQLQRQLERDLAHSCPEDATVVPGPRHVKYAIIMAKTLRLKTRRPTSDSGGYDGTTAPMTREERTELAQARREVMLNLQGDNVVMTVGADEEPVPYKRQGDPTVNTPRSIARRHALRKKPLIQEISNEYWNFPELNPNASDEMSKESYLNLNRKLHLALIPETTEEEAVESAELDWVRDTSKWGGRMTKEAFASSMFELADIWTENIDEEEYAAFLWLLLETITNTNVMPPSFKPDQDIECIVDTGLSEANDQTHCASMDEERERTSKPHDSDIAAVLTVNDVAEGMHSLWLKEKHSQRLRELRERLQALKDLRMLEEGSKTSGRGALEDENADGNRGSRSGSGSGSNSHDSRSRSPLAASESGRQNDHSRTDDGVSSDKARTSASTFVARERRPDERGGGTDPSYTDVSGLDGAAFEGPSLLERRNPFLLDEDGVEASYHRQDFDTADGQTRRSDGPHPSSRAVPTFQRMSEHRDSERANIKVSDGSTPEWHASQDFHNERKIRPGWDGISRTTDEEWEPLVQEAREKKRLRADTLTQTRAGPPAGKHSQGTPIAANGSDRSAEEGEEEEEGGDGKIGPTSPLEGLNAHEATGTPTGTSLEPSRPPAQHVIRGLECVEGAIVDGSWCSETVEDGHRRENSDLRDGVRCDSRIAQVSSPYSREDDDIFSGGGLSGGMGEDKGKAGEHGTTEDCWWWPEDVIGRLQGTLANHNMLLEDIFERTTEASVEPRIVVRPTTKHHDSASVGHRPMGNDAVSARETMLQPRPQVASSPSHAAGMPGRPTNDIKYNNMHSDPPSSGPLTLPGSSKPSKDQAGDRLGSIGEEVNTSPFQLLQREGIARDKEDSQHSPGSNLSLINSAARIEQWMNQSTTNHSPYPGGNHAPRANAYPDAAAYTRAVDDGVMPGAVLRFKAGPNPAGGRYILNNSVSVRIAASGRSAQPEADASGTRNKPKGEDSLIDRAHDIDEPCSVLGHDGKKEISRTLQQTGGNVVTPDAELEREALERTGNMKRAIESTINAEEEMATVNKSHPLRGNEVTPKPYGPEINSSRDDSEIVAAPWQEARSVITREGITAVAGVLANKIVEVDGTLYAKALNEVYLALIGVEEQIRETTATSRLVGPPNVDLAASRDGHGAPRIQTERSSLMVGLGNIQQGTTGAGVLTSGEGESPSQLRPKRGQIELGEHHRAPVTGDDTRESPMVESGTPWVMDVMSGESAAEGSPWNGRTPTAPAHHTRQVEDDDYLSPGGLSGGRLKQEDNLVATTGGLSSDDKTRKTLSCERLPADHARTSRGDFSGGNPNGDNSAQDESASPGGIADQLREEPSRETACSSLVGKRTWSERDLPSSYGRSRHSEASTRGEGNTGDGVASNKLSRPGTAYPSTDCSLRQAPMDYDIHRLEAEYRYELAPRARRGRSESNCPGNRFNAPPPQGNAYQRRSTTRDDISGERRQEVGGSGGSTSITRGHIGGIPTRGGSADDGSSSRFGKWERKNLPSSWQHHERQPGDVRAVSEWAETSHRKDGWRRPRTTGGDESSLHCIEQARTLGFDLQLPPWRNPAPGEHAWHPILNCCEMKQGEGSAVEIQERRLRNFLCCRGSGNHDTVRSDSSWDRSTRIQLCVGVTQPSVGEREGISAHAITPATAFTRRVKSVGLLGRTPLNQVPSVPEGSSTSLRITRSLSPTNASRNVGNPRTSTVEGVTSGPGFNGPFLATLSSPRLRSCGGTLASSSPLLRMLLDPGGAMISKNVEYTVPLRVHSPASAEDGASVRPIDRHQQGKLYRDTAETERPLPTAKTDQKMGREWVRPPSLVITPLVGSHVQRVSGPPLWSLSPITYPRSRTHAGSGSSCWTREFCLRHAQGRSRLAPATRTAGGRWGRKHGHLDTMFHGEKLHPSLPSTAEKVRWDKVLGPNADQKM